MNVPVGVNNVTFGLFGDNVCPQLFGKNLVFLFIDITRTSYGVQTLSKQGFNNYNKKEDV